MDGDFERYWMGILKANLQPKKTFCSGNPAASAGIEFDFWRIGPPV
jgi:hypothetical protein